uniref:Transmembrane protein n=1 Tax=Strongyloides stercoralis TaxID=6248 RepID=A0A0K0ENK8_STRER
MLSIWNKIINEIKSDTLKFVLLSASGLGVILVVLTYFNDEDIFSKLTDAQRRRKMKKEMRKIEKNLIKRKRRMQVFRENVKKISNSDNNNYSITSDTSLLNRK